MKEAQIKKSVTAKETKQDVFEGALQGLENEIGSLENIAARISGKNPEAPIDEIKTPEISLSTFLTEGPAVIDNFRSRINAVRDELNEALF